MLLSLSSAGGSLQDLRLLNNLLAHWQLIFSHGQLWRRCDQGAVESGSRRTLALLQLLLFKQRLLQFIILLCHLYVAEPYKFLCELMHFVDDKLRVFALLSTPAIVRRVCDLLAADGMVIVAT